jgi:hypothetical protein
MRVCCSHRLCHGTMPSEQGHMNTGIVIAQRRGLHLQPFNNLHEAGSPSLERIDLSHHVILTNHSNLAFCLLGSTEQT